MKTKHVLILATLAFLAVSIFLGVWVWKAKRLATKVAVLETNYATSEQEKLKLIAELSTITEDNTILIQTKQILEKQLAQERKATDEKIREYESTIEGLLAVPVDTVYEILFTYHDPFNGVLKYRFAENQIRGFYEDILQRDYFKSLYNSTTKSLNTCTNINQQNNSIIRNLGEQNANLKHQVRLGEGQINNIQDQLSLSKKQLGKTKRNSWVFKGAAVLGWAAFIFK